jgi:ribonuclease BN (tRNA processing enzyme)
MNIVFIGTSSGRTSLNRFHSSILFEHNKFGLLVDAGDGISRALLAADKNYDDINFILFTHYHADHFGGIGALVTQMKIHGRKKPLKIVTCPGLRKPLIHFLNCCYLFLNDLGFELIIIESEFDDEIKLAKDFSFRLGKNKHVLKKSGVEFIDEPKFVSSSILFNYKNNYLFYTSDVGSSKDLELFNDYSIDLMISETTHLPLKSIADFAVKSKIKHVYLTHIDEPDETEIINFAKRINKEKKISLNAAVDGMTINLTDVF